MPHRNGVCADVWKTLDGMYQPVVIPTLQQVRQLARERNWNLNNAQAEYYAWRRAHGISGRVGAN